MREQVNWAEPNHKLWPHFAEWSGRNVSPGGGHGHLVEWYWTIFKEGAYAQEFSRMKEPLIPHPQVRP